MNERRPEQVITETKVVQESQAAIRRHPLATFWDERSTDQQSDRFLHLLQLLVRKLCGRRRRARRLSRRLHRVRVAALHCLLGRFRHYVRFRHSTSPSYTLRHIQLSPTSSSCTLRHIQLSPTSSSFTLRHFKLSPTSSSYTLRHLKLSPTSSSYTLRHFKLSPTSHHPFESHQG